jgi:phospholipid:diacylglycerol acyltransferase
VSSQRDGENSANQHTIPKMGASRMKSKKSQGHKNKIPKNKRKSKMDDSESSSVTTPIPIVVEADKASMLPASLGDLDEDDSRAGGNGESQSQTSTGSSGSSKRRRSSILVAPPRRYIALGLCLWIAEFVFVIVAKRVGLVEPEFLGWEEALVQNVIPRIEQSWGKLNESIPLGYLTQEKKRPGFQLKQQGAAANYPVILIPGFVTSGLEVWGGKECARKHFRQRLWAAIGGARSFFMERDCWLAHMMLDPYTGGDPEDIRLRAAQGFEAADYFMANYWVFGKLIENLADVGYDSSTMSMEPYDWRLAFPILEERDGYLTKLKLKIEAMHKTSGKKVVLTSHSMGAQLIHYFFAWVTRSEKSGGGGGGKKWVDQHVYSYVNIAGTHLGVPKAATSLLSGEMSDTVFIGTLGQMVENFFGRRLRKDLWTTWGSLWTMLPKGGDALWGIGADMCDERSADDPLCPETGLSPLLLMTASDKNKISGLYSNITPNSNITPGSHVDEMKENITPTDPAAAVVGEENATEMLEPGPTSYSPISPSMEKFLSRPSHSLVETLDFLQDWGGGLGSDIANAKMHSLHGKESSSSKSWHDVSRTPLPYSPNVRMYCFYGTGIETERAFYYKRNREEQSASDPDKAPPSESEPPAVLDPDVMSEDQHVSYGIRFSDGDGSVPILSLGYICADAWTRKDSGLNPSGAKVVTREYLHRAEFWVDDPMRSGPASSDHVDILGNLEMMEDFLKIVTDFESSTVNENRIVSDIESIAAKINAHPSGGIFKRNRFPF